MMKLFIQIETYYQKKKLKTSSNWTNFFKTLKKTLAEMKWINSNSVKNLILCFNSFFKKHSKFGFGLV